jgi:hypothetical protein
MLGGCHQLEEAMQRDRSKRRNRIFAPPGGVKHLMYLPPPSLFLSSIALNIRTKQFRRLKMAGKLVARILSAISFVHVL